MVFEMSPRDVAKYALERAKKEAIQNVEENSSMASNGMNFLRRKVLVAGLAAVVSMGIISEQIVKPSSYTQNVDQRSTYSQNEAYGLMDEIQSPKKDIEEKLRRETLLSKIEQDVEKGGRSKARSLQEYPMETLDYLTKKWVDENLKSEKKAVDIENALERARPYLPALKYIFTQNGLPGDEVFLAVIESRFQDSAVSPKNARGAWQLMESTAKRHGGVIDSRHDIRHNTLLAGEIAAKVLKHSLDETGDLDLARAAYNSSLVGNYVRKDSKDGFKGYISFLGRILEENPLKVKKAARENLGFIIKNKGLREILRRKYPQDLNVPPSNQGFIVYEIGPHMEVVNDGEGYWNLAERYGSILGVSDVESRVRIMNWMQKNINGGKVLYPNQTIKIYGPKSLEELSKLIGRDISEENPHIPNAKKELPKGSKLVLKI